MSSNESGFGAQSNISTGPSGSTASGRLHETVAPRSIAGISLSNIVVPALAITGACLAVVTAASAIEARRSRKLDRLLSLAGIGTVIGGAILLAGIRHVVSRRMLARRG